MECEDLSADSLFRHLSVGSRLINGTKSSGPCVVCGQEELKNEGMFLL